MNITPINGVSFGMARFTKEGMSLAKKSGENEAASPNNYNNEKYYKRPIFGKPAFYTYLSDTLPADVTADDATIQKVKDKIIAHGTTPIGTKNAEFITRQLMHSSTQGHIEKLKKQQKHTYNGIIEAERTLFDANWNNPELSKQDTKKLLDKVKSTMSEPAYLKWSGMIENSDTTLKN